VLDLETVVDLARIRAPEQISSTLVKSIIVLGFLHEVKSTLRAENLSVCDLMSETKPSAGFS
jgi:hypothetical protein